MRHSVTLAVLLIPGIVMFGSSAAAQSTAFTYQGELKNSGQLANGLHDFQFRLFDAASGGSQVGATACLDNVSVVNGRFTVQVDFGQQFAAPASRFLEIQVRADTGLDCTSAAGFVTLSRQPVTATPLADHAKSAYALDAPDGSPLNAVFVDSGGLVGINTTNPGTNLTIAGNMELGSGAGDYRNFRIGGGNSSGFLYGSFPAFADGIHLGYNFYADNAGTLHIPRTDGQTSRLTTGYGFIALATGGTNQAPINRLVVAQDGTVRIGNNTQLYVPGGDENLRMVRGVVGTSGNIIVGSGFSVGHPSAGHYTVTFTTPFSGPPAVTASCDLGLSVGTGYGVDTQGVTASAANLLGFIAPNGAAIDVTFHFVAIGPR